MYISQVEILKIVFSILSGTCLLPQQPESGSYTSPVCEHGGKTCQHIPGASVPENWLLKFNCNDGYTIDGTRFEDTVFIFCINGNWSDKIPVCKSELLQTCRKIKHLYLLIHQYKF